MIKHAYIGVLIITTVPAALANLPAPSTCRTVATWDFSDPSLISKTTQGPVNLGPGELVGDGVKESWIARTPNHARSGWWPSVGGDHTTGGNGIDSKFLLVSSVDQAGEGKLLYSKMLTNLTVGREYTVELWLANTYINYDTTVTIELPDGLGGHLITPIFSTQPPMISNSDTVLPWNNISMSFTAITTTQPLEIINRHGRDGSRDNGNDLAIDDISISYSDCAITPDPGNSVVAVPMLETYGLALLAGLIGAGTFVARRKKK